MQSQVSGKGQDKKHLTPWLFLPATSSNSRREMCSWGNNNQAYQGTNSSRHSQCRCPTNYSPPGQNRFYSINDPCYIAQLLYPRLWQQWHKSLQLTPLAGFCNSHQGQLNVFHGCAGGGERSDGDLKQVLTAGLRLPACKGEPGGVI